MAYDSDVEDEQLQQALALSLQEYAASPATAAAQCQQRQQEPGQQAAARKAGQGDGAAGASTQRAARGPMRGKRRQPEQAEVKLEPGSPPAQRPCQEQQLQQPSPQQQQQQPFPQQQRERPLLQQQREQPPLQQGSGAVAASPDTQPAGGAAKPAAKPATKPRQPRKKKLALWSPSEAEVEAMFELLTGGGGALLTVERLAEVRCRA